MANEQRDLNSESACDQALSRKEFLNKVLKGAAITGGLLVAPLVLDKFLVQAVAAASGCACPGAQTVVCGVCSDTRNAANVADGGASIGSFGCAGICDVTTTTIPGNVADSFSCCSLETCISPAPAGGC